MQCGGYCLYGSPQAISGWYLVSSLQLVFMTFKNIIDWYVGEVTVHQFKIHESMTFEQIDRLCHIFLFSLLSFFPSFCFPIQKLLVAFRNFSGTQCLCYYCRKPKPKLPFSSNRSRRWNANRNSLGKQRLRCWTFFEYFRGFKRQGWYSNVFSNSFETMHVQWMKAYHVR